MMKRALCLLVLIGCAGEEPPAEYAPVAPIHAAGAPAPEPAQVEAQDPHAAERWIRGQLASRGEFLTRLRACQRDLPNTVREEPSDMLSSRPPITAATDAELLKSLHDVRKATSTMIAEERACSLDRACLVERVATRLCLASATGIDPKSAVIGVGKFYYEKISGTAFVPSLCTSELATTLDRPVVRDAKQSNGIALGRPEVFGEDDATVVAVLVRNDTSSVRSFLMTTSFEVDGHVIAKANGAVSDLRPGERRAVSLALIGTVPDDYKYRSETTAMIVGKSHSSAGDAAAKIAFGDPVTEVGQGPIKFTEIDATNLNELPIQGLVGVAFLWEGGLVRTSAGTASLSPGATQRLRLVVTGDTAEVPRSDEQLVFAHDVVR
jgi:hypothetical protein